MNKETMKVLVSTYEEEVIQMKELMDRLPGTYSIDDIKKLNKVTGKILALHDILLKMIDKEES